MTDIGPEDVWEDPRDEMFERPYDEEEPPDDYWDAPIIEAQQLPISWTTR